LEILQLSWHLFAGHRKWTGEIDNRLLNPNIIVVRSDMYGAVRLGGAGGRGARCALSHHMIVWDFTFLAQHRDVAYIDDRHKI